MTPIEAQLRTLNSPAMNAAMDIEHRSPGAFARNGLIALTAFLTLVDLFAAQAILPSLVERYGVSPGEMGFAVNACTFGMAVAGLAVALLARRIDRRTGILVSLAVLALPTALLAHAPDLTTFTLLRIAQGLCMAAAFTLTLAYLGERFSAADAAGAFAAYITGNVASNLFGRLLSAALADQAGLTWNFHVFAALNLAGAMLVFFSIERTPRMQAMSMPDQTPGEAWLAHLRNAPLVAAFGIGFCILFAFIGTFTYVNFVLARPPLSVGAMQLGLVYLVFVPSVITTPLAGAAVAHYGARTMLWASLALAGAGLPLLLSSSLAFVLTGLVLIGVGTFFAQATATGAVSRIARGDRGAASGMYLASYFFGGLAGSAVLGWAFDHAGWRATVAGIGLALLLAAALSMLIPRRLPANPGTR